MNRLLLWGAKRRDKNFAAAAALQKTASLHCRSLNCIAAIRTPIPVAALGAVQPLPCAELRVCKGMERGAIENAVLARLYIESADLARQILLPIHPVPYTYPMPQFTPCRKWMSRFGTSCSGALKTVFTAIRTCIVLRNCIFFICTWTLTKRPKQQTVK